MDVNALLREAHGILRCYFLNIYEQATKAYKLFGRGSLVVRFESLEELHQFVGGKIAMHRATFFDMLQLARMNHVEIVDAVRTYDPFSEFVMTTMVVLPESRQFGYNVSVYGLKHGKPVERWNEVVKSE